MRFSDLTPGLVVRSQPRLVTQKEMIEFASRYDPQWFHVDPVRANDTVALHFEVLRSSKSPSNRTSILLSKSELWNQNDRQVLTLQGTTLFDLSPAPRPR